MIVEEKTIEMNIPIAFMQEVKLLIKAMVEIEKQIIDRTSEQIFDDLSLMGHAKSKKKWCK